MEVFHKILHFYNGYMDMLNNFLKLLKVKLVIQDENNYLKQCLHILFLIINILVHNIKLKNIKIK